MDIVYTIR